MEIGDSFALRMTHAYGSTVLLAIGVEEHNGSELQMRNCSKRLRYMLRHERFQLQTCQQLSTCGLQLRARAKRCYLLGTLSAKSIGRKYSDTVLQRELQDRNVICHDVASSLLVMLLA